MTDETYPMGLTLTMKGGAPQEIYRFENGYGASIVHHEYSRGGWELAVIVFSDDGEDFRITYSTHITDDVVGWLDAEQEAELLQDIEDLPEVNTTHYQERKEHEEELPTMITSLIEESLRGW